MLLDKSGEIAPEGMKRRPKQKRCPVMDVSGGESKADAVKSDSS